MKKIFALVIALVLLAGCTAACGGGGAAGNQGKIQIVTTVFPIYDWVMNVLGENPAEAEVTMLLDSSVDLHSFQPAAADILKIAGCDLFVFVGGESDEWTDSALKEAAVKDRTVIDLMEVLGDAAKEETEIEGMQEEHDHGHGEEKEYDEHVWLSLKNAVRFVEAISGAVQKIDPAHAGQYQKNAEVYTEKLKALDAEYQAAVSAAPVSTILFGDRFPFRYLAEDYGLTYYAAFSGCSAESEASFETISFLARKVDELSLHAVMTIEGADRRIAETIIQNTQTKDQKILTMDSLQSTTAKEAAAGKTYLSVMEQNLSVLRDALK